MKESQDPSNRLLKHHPPGKRRGIFNRSSKPGVLHDDKHSNKDRNIPPSATPKPPATMTLALTRNPDDAQPVRRSIDNAARPQSNPKDKREKNEPLLSTAPDQQRNNSREGDQENGKLNLFPGQAAISHINITVHGKTACEGPDNAIQQEMMVEKSNTEELPIKDDAVDNPDVDPEQASLDIGGNIARLECELQGKCKEVDNLLNLNHQKETEILELKKEVASLGKEVLAMHESIKSQDNLIEEKESQRRALQQDLHQVKSNSSCLRNEMETLKARSLTQERLLSDFQATLEQRDLAIACLKSSHDGHKTEIATLNQRIQQSNAKIKEQEKDIETYKQTFEELKDYIVEREKQINQLSENNEYLSNVISETKKPLAQNHVDSYYLDRIDALNHFISSHVAEMCKWEASRTFRPSDAGLKEVLRLVGPLGKSDVAYLRNTFIWTLNKDSRRRIVALRFLIGLCLHKFIFETFAFGIETVRGEILRQTEDAILQIEPDFSKALIIRQAMGRAAMSMMEDTTGPRERLRHFTDTVGSIVGKLLPQNGSVPQFVGKIAEMAISLANDLTVEQMVFRSSFVDHGTDPKQVAVDVVDERQTGRVLLCTFPGFWRLVRVDGRVQQMALRRPSVELHSAFE